VDPADFVAKYPTLLHLADVRSWPSIERHGLLSAAEIVRRWQVPPDRAEALLTRKRPEPVLLDHPELGVAVLRDQHLLREHLLAPALTDGMNVGDWLRLLNGFVFFFTSSDRLQALRSAYRTTPAVLLTVRTRSLVQEHGARVRLAGMNTGNTSRRVKERGAGTFLPVRRYDLRARVQEVAVMDEVSDLRDHLLSAELLLPTTEADRQLHHRCPRAAAPAIAPPS
jgi:hypothetical protein